MNVNDVRIGAVGGYQPAVSGKVKEGAVESTPVSNDQFKASEVSEDPVYKTMTSLFNDSKVTDQFETKQFADSYGRVKHLALMMSNYASGRIRSQMLNGYKLLFTKMEPDTKFTIVVGSDRDRADVEKVIKENDVPNPDRFQFVKPNAGGLTVWARDMMVGMYDPNSDDHTVLLGQSMLHDWHADDTKVPKAITDANPTILLDEEKRLVTDGGDTLSNTKESFVGNYSFSATANKIASLVRGNDEVRHDLIKFYENRFNTKVQTVDNDKQLFPYKFIPVKYPQEVHRINFKMVDNPEYREVAPERGVVPEKQMYEDMALKLFEKQFGKPVTIMGKDDPATAHKEEPATDHMDMGTTPVDDKTFFVGDPELFKQILGSMSKEEIRDAEEKMSQMAGEKVNLEEMLDARNRDNPEDFKAYVKTLEEKGYRVERMPHSEPSYGTPYISYNNCLMERFDKNGDGTEYRRVFLPVYGIEKLDNFAIQRFEKEGFEVVPMPLDALSARWGALRCISNWLDRSPKG